MQKLIQTSFIPGLEHEVRPEYRAYVVLRNTDAHDLKVIANKHKQTMTEIVANALNYYRKEVNTQ